MKAIRWVLFNGGFSASIYFGAYLEHDGASNVAMFIAWVTIVMSLLLLSDTFIEKIKEKALKPSVPRWVDVFFDTAVIFSLIYIGWIITGVFYFIHLILAQGSYEKIFCDNK